MNCAHQRPPAPARQGRTEGDSAGLEPGCQGSSPGPHYPRRTSDLPSAVSSSAKCDDGSALAVRIKGMPVTRDLQMSALSPTSPPMLTGTLSAEAWDSCPA